MAIFEFLVKGIVHSGHHKLSAFNCYLMTLMLNLSCYDLAFHFNISVPTVSRILSRWIFMMDNKMKDMLTKWPSREALQKIAVLFSRTIWSVSCSYYRLF